MNCRHAMPCACCLNQKRLPLVTFYDEDGERSILCLECFEMFKWICLRNMKPVPTVLNQHRRV